MRSYWTALRPARTGVLVVSVGSLACGPSGPPLAAADSDPGSHLFAWVTDSDSVDLNFLAVIDADPSSGSYGEVLRTLPVPTSGRTRGHHTEHRMPAGGFLFANDFGTGITWVLDLRDPANPLVADSFDAAGPFTSPHSFERLPNGNVLATFQNEGPGNTAPGGLAELGPTGDVVRWGRASDGDRYLRPYSLALLPDADRVVSGSADMRGEGDSHVVQVWRLSDLSVIRSIDIPPEWGAAAEPRVLSDGRTVMVTTFGCRLLRISGVDTPTPTAEAVHDFGGTGCALPIVVGDYWIQAVPDAHGLVALDVSDPAAPWEVSRVTLSDDDWPHWISLAPDRRRVVVTGYAGTRHRIILVDLDPVTAQMSVDRDFGDPASDRPGISMDVDSWPHGATGPGDPHGVVFSRPAVVRPPVLDMHLHALRAADQGPPPLAFCLPIESWPAVRRGSEWPEAFLRRQKEPPCADPVWSAGSDGELMERTLAIMDRYNVIGVTSGPRLAAWQAAAGDRIIPGVLFGGGPGAPPVDTLRRWFESGRTQAFGEVTIQYRGLEPGDPSFAPHLALAEEMDVPVGIHVGTGPPGAPYLGFSAYRARLHSPLLLEEVLLRHPDLRLYVMHAGWPMLDDLLALLWAHPQVHVGLGVISYGLPRPEFYRYLQRLVDAGFGDRVMFGSDQMVWPEALEFAIRGIEEAPFLSEEQKRAILYDNAARFLELSDEVVDAHHGRR